MAEVEPVVKSQSKLGEGPLWSVDEQALYWVDIHNQRVERFHPESRQHQVFDFEIAVTALGFRAKGGFVAATTRGFAFMNLSTKEINILSHPEANKPHNRFNDGVVDPKGRFWGGTMYDGPETNEPTEGCLYRLDVDGSVHIMETGMTISNGLGWSPDLKTMYFTDTLRRLIYAYDFDATTGSIDHRRVFVDTSGETGFPDGLTVDNEGGVWSARWGGWKISRYDPTGKVEREISLSIECPSSCTFGGENLDELYITSAWTALSDEQRRKQPLAGDIFRVATNIKGRVPWKFAG
jgi:sugar lactone lactonase YvrE